MRTVEPRSTVWGVRQKNVTSPKPRTLTPVRASWSSLRSLVAPAVPRGAFGALTLLHNFLCKSDSCEKADSCLGLVLFRADSGVGLIGVNQKKNVVRFGGCQEKMFLTLNSLGEGGEWRGRGSSVDPTTQTVQHDIFP